MKPPLSPDDLRALLAQVAIPAKESLSAALKTFDADPIGHVACELLRARVRGELDGRDAFLSVLHQATKKEPWNP
jgi:hypothetical protein